MEMASHDREDLGLGLNRAISSIVLMSVHRKIAI